MVAALGQEVVGWLNPKVAKHARCGWLEVALILSENYCHLELSFDLFEIHNEKAVFSGVRRSCGIARRSAWRCACVNA
jgi:hypothetical protein